ncbi:hypothetical protein ACQP00_24855 [Dactylosporangium sp. CS-047395]|uniref:hypothetical protein n=1 Tax=Dactylosporangium sp. CS-047395 TaxID=3239936 RepID=UPI003D929E07
MTTDDRSDLDALRALAEPRTVTTPEELARLRYRILRSDAPRTRSHVRAWLAPAAAAVVALAVLAGVGIALNRDGGSRSPGLSPAPSGSVTFGATLDPQATLAELQRVAATTEPLAAKDKDQLHVRADMLVPAGGPNGGIVPQVHDTWYEIQGFVTVRALSDGRPDDEGPKGESLADLDRAEFREQGPGPRHPTPQWLAGLESEPTALAQQLGVTGPGDENAWGICTQLWALADPLLPGDARVGLLGLLAGLDGVTFRSVTIGGQETVAIARVMGRNLQVFMLDPGTAHVVGLAVLERGGAGPSPSPGVIDTRPSPGIDRLAMQWLYSYELVKP